MPAYISTLGTTASRSSVNVVAQVSGQISEIRFKQGDLVKKGDILAVIDKRPFAAAVKQAEGNLAQAKAQLKIDQLQVGRNRTLAKDNYVDKQTFDTLVAKVEVDKGQVEAWRGGSRNCENQPRLVRRRRSHGRQDVAFQHRRGATVVAAGLLRLS